MKYEYLMLFLKCIHLKNNYEINLEVWKTPYNKNTSKEKDEQV